MASVLIFLSGVVFALNLWFEDDPPPPRHPHRPGCGAGEDSN